jgi:hypothetical protein
VNKDGKEDSRTQTKEQWPVCLGIEEKALYL